MQHKFFSIARRDYLFNGPLACPPGERPEILDLGTGTGIWAIDMAEYVFVLESSKLGDMKLTLVLANFLRPGYAASQGSHIAPR